MKDKVQERLASWLNRPTRNRGVLEAESFGSLATTIGGVRTENQDRAIVAKYNGGMPNEPFLLFGLCDGIGGMRDGGICASQGLSTVVTALIRAREQPLSNRFRRSVLAANEDICEQYHENGGCTFSGIVVGRLGEAFVINVGDSRIYSQRGEKLVQLTQDDNIGNQLQLLGQAGLQPGFITRQLTQYLGLGRALEAKPERLDSTQWVHFLTSDGVHCLGEGILPAVIQALANSAGDKLTEIARRVTTIADWVHAADNATLVCVPANVHELAARLSQQPPGLLEVWDCFGKLEMFTDYGDGYQAPPACQEVPKPERIHYPKLHAGSSKSYSYEKQQAKRNKKAPAKREAASPEVQITLEPAS